MNGTLQAFLDEVARLPAGATVTAAMIPCHQRREWWLEVLTMALAALPRTDQELTKGKSC